MTAHISETWRANIQPTAEKVATVVGDASTHCAATSVCGSTCGLWET